MLRSVLENAQRAKGRQRGTRAVTRFGMSLTDECTALDKPLHGCIESDLLQLVRGTLVHRLTTVVKNVHLLATSVRPSHAFFAPLLEPAIPNFCAQLFVWSHFDRTSRILLSKRTTSSMVSASVRRACKRKLSTALITCFCPHLESCALPEKKTRKRPNGPVSFITVNCADVCVVRITLGFSVTAKASCEIEVESCVASSFSATKLSLDWQQNSTPAPTASGLRREWMVAILSTGQFHACVCGPKFLVNNIWSLVHTHIFVPRSWKNKACSSCCRCQAWRF